MKYIQRKDIETSKKFKKEFQTICKKMRKQTKNSYNQATVIIYTGKNINVKIIKSGKEDFFAEKTKTTDEAKSEEVEAKPVEEVKKTTEKAKEETSKEETKEENSN